jgi:hypothetical protein
MAVRFAVSQRQRELGAKDIVVGVSVTVSAVWFDLSSCAQVKVILQRKTKEVP